MMLEAILFPVQLSASQSTDKAERVFVFFKLLLVLTQGCKLVDDDGSYNLLDDDLDGKQVDEVNHDVLQFLSCEVSEYCVGTVSEPDNTRIHPQP